MLDSQGPITKMSPEDANTTIQEMVQHSQMWHDGASSRRRTDEGSDGLATIKV